MFAVLNATTPCLLCGYRVKVIMCGSMRVNKCSLRITGPLLGGVMYRRCPECGTGIDGEVVPRSRYVLAPDIAAKVAAYRARRWPPARGPERRTAPNSVSRLSLGEETVLGDLRAARP